MKVVKHFLYIQYRCGKQSAEEYSLNSLTAMDAHEHPLSTVVSQYHSFLVNFCPLTEFDSTLNMQEPQLLCGIFLFLQHALH
jgi:hypothetical protein